MATDRRVDSVEFSPLLQQGGHCVRLTIPCSVVQRLSERHIDVNRVNGESSRNDELVFLFPFIFLCAGFFAGSKSLGHGTVFAKLAD